MIFSEFQEIFHFTSPIENNLIIRRVNYCNSAFEGKDLVIVLLKDARYDSLEEKQSNGLKVVKTKERRFMSILI